jgi:DNA modification methylase
METEALHYLCWRHMTSQISPSNKLNELPGDQWLYFTKSLLNTNYPYEYGHELRKAHGANKPPRLMSQIIEFFTKPDALILDPFAGVGGTLIGASICAKPRMAVGIEINQKWVEVYHQVLALHTELQSQQMLQGDCLRVMATMEASSFDFIAFDPPYNIHLKQTMSGGNAAEQHTNRRTDYDMRSHDPADLANLACYEEYLDAMERVFVECSRLLKPKKYLVFIVRNAYQHGEYSFVQADLARRARPYGLITKGEIVWSQAGTRLRPYGYPFAYVPNITHQYIIVLCKQEERTRIS